MTPPRRRPARRGLATFAVLAILGLTAAPARAAQPGTSLSPARAAANWLATELEANEGMLTVSFGGPDEFPDQGLTIDAILGIIAAGEAADPAVALSLDTLADPVNLMPYITGFETDADRAANATAKTLLLEEISGADVSDGIDLEADLRDVMETSGSDVGRFSDSDSLGWGNFANTIGQSLAIVALDRTASGVPSEAIDFLLGEQCPNGSFRLYHTDPAVTTDPHVCTDDAEGDADATAFALQALLIAPSSPAVSTAVSGAVDHLLAQQQASGGFFGTGAVNSNTTGLAASALRAAGETGAADDGAAFLAALQTDDCAELGAIAYDQAAFDAGIAADRAQWTRATAQGVLGLGLPAYGDIGSVAPVTAGLDAVTCPVATTVVPKVTASVGSIVAGGTLTLHGVGFAPGETVDVTLHSAPVALGSFTADPDGEVTAPVTIPADVEPGVHTISMAGETSGVQVEVSIEVTGQEADPAQQLPATGSATAELGLAGALLVLGGTALVLASDRRRAAIQAT
ncbi:MAG: prenyltransferase/squalene oxidase repeat-containing protein [Acidimicrobiales bacterium]